MNSVDCKRKYTVHAALPPDDMYIIPPDMYIILGKQLYPMLYIRYLLLGLFEDVVSADTDVIPVAFRKHIPDGLEFGPRLGRFEDMIAKEQQLLVGRSPLRVGRGRFGKHLCRLILRQFE